MWRLYFLAFLVHAAYSCQDGVEIVSRDLDNLEDAIGNWTYVYHWDNENQFPTEFIDNGKDYSEDCPTIEITRATQEHIDEKKKECAGLKYPFDWENAKLKFDAPVASLKNSLIIKGNNENWMVVDCSSMIRMVMKHVADDYMVMINPDVGHISELMAKKIPKTEELKCIVHNVDIGKGMQGIGLCS